MGRHEGQRCSDRCLWIKYSNAKPDAWNSGTSLQRPHGAMPSSKERLPFAHNIQSADPHSKNTPHPPCASRISYLSRRSSLSIFALSLHIATMVRLNLFPPSASVRQDQEN